MWTWTAIFALAFVVQGSLGVPTFGTGPQQEWWNEVDDEYPGEIHQPDDVTPLSEIDLAKNDDQESSLDKKSSAPNNLPISPTEEFLPAPTPTPRPPTVSDFPQEDPNGNSDLKEPQQLASSIPAPPTPRMGEIVKEALTHPHSPDLLPAKGEQSLSGAGNLENNEVIKFPYGFPPNPKYIVTVKPNTAKTQINTPTVTPLITEKEEEHLEDIIENVAEAVESSEKSDQPQEDSSRNADVKESQKLTSSIPASSVPRMGEPTKDTFKYQQSPDVLPYKEEVSQSGAVGSETNAIMRNAGRFSPRTRYIVTLGRRKANKPMNSLPLTLLRNGREGEGLEDIFKDVARVLNSLSSPRKENMHQSTFIPPLPDLNSNVENKDDSERIFDILSPARRRLYLPPPLDDIQQYGSNEYGNKFSPPRREYVRVKLIPQVYNPPPTKTIKSVLLKSLVPREYFVIKDIYDILKARAIATAINEEEEDLFKPDLLQGLRSDGRYVAVSPARPPHTNLPQLYFPDREQQFLESKLEPGPEIPDFDEFTKPNFPEDQLITRYREGLNQFFNSYVNRQPIADPRENIEVSDEADGSDSKMKNLINFLQSEFGGQVDSMIKDSEVSPALERFLLTEEDPKKYGRIGFYR